MSVSQLPPGIRTKNVLYILGIFEQLEKSRGTRLCALDFGCGSGSLIREARRVGYDFVGADNFFLSEESENTYLKEMDEAVKPFIARIGTDDRLPYPDEYFDFVCSDQVFEHIRNGYPFRWVRVRRERRTARGRAGRSGER